MKVTVHLRLIRELPSGGDTLEGRTRPFEYICLFAVRPACPDDPRLPRLSHHDADKIHNGSGRDETKHSRRSACEPQPGVKTR